MKARSLLFGAVFFLWTAFITVPFSFLLVLPRRLLVWHLYVWAQGVMLLLRLTVGITYEVVGCENIPKGPALFLVNHQSMWETVIFHILAYRHDPCYIMKRELLFIPFYNVHALKFGMIGIRRGRKHGLETLRKLSRLVPLRLRRGQSVVIFPEGTRVLPGEEVPYGVGAYALYRIACDERVPVVCAAMNAGVFWKRGFFDKSPGKIRIEFLRPVPAGLNRQDFDREMARLRAAVAKLHELRPV